MLRRTPQAETGRAGRPTRRLAFVLTLFASLSFFTFRPSSPLAARVDAGSVYPPEQSLVANPQPSMPQPGYLNPSTVPDLGTQVMRLADQAAFHTTQQYIRHYYSLNEPWNADESLLCLCYINPAPLLDGHTYRFVRWLKVPSASNDLLWSPVDPNALFTTARTTPSLEVLHPQTDMTDSPTVLHTFAQYDAGTVQFGPRKGNITLDGQWLVVTGSHTAGGVTNYGMTVYNLLNQTEGPTFWFGTSAPSWAGISPRGDYVVAHFSSAGMGRFQGVELYDRQLRFLRQITSDPQHADMGLDTDGSEVYVSVLGLANCDLSVYALASTNARCALPSHSIRGHVSCRNVARPGWCYVSDEDMATDERGLHEIFAVKLDGSGTVELFSHDFATPSIEYEAEPHAVPNHDGTRVLFASDWQKGAQAPVYSYVVQEPSAASSPPSPTTPPTPVNTPVPTAQASPTALQQTPVPVPSATPVATQAGKDKFHPKATPTSAIRSPLATPGPNPRPRPRR